MTIIKSDLQGVLLIQPSVFSDSRGYFIEPYQRQRYIEAGITADFVQSNMSYSHAGILTMIKTFEAIYEMSWGTSHYCGGGRTTYHHFAEKIFEIARQYTLLTVDRVFPASTDEYPTAAKRPKNSVFNCKAIRENYCVEQKPWHQSLEEKLKCLLAGRLADP